MGVRAPFGSIAAGATTLGQMVGQVAAPANAASSFTPALPAGGPGSLLALGRAMLGRRANPGGTSTPAQPEKPGAKTGSSAGIAGGRKGLKTFSLKPSIDSGERTY